MVDWVKKDSTFKPFWMFNRMILNLAIYYSMSNEPGFTDELCGPLAIPIDPNNFSILIIIQVTTFVFYGITNFLDRDNYRLRRLIDSRTPKVIIGTFLKLWIVFSKAQRRKYYIHSFLIQLTIWICSLPFDCFGLPKLAEAWEIMIIDSFQRVSIFYLLTRTFCPYFAIYWFFINLILLTMSQIQAHLIYYFPNSQRADPIYPGALYVKQDIYRLMIMAFVYFGLYSFLQTSAFGYGMAVTFVISAIPFINSIRRVKAGQFKQALILLLIVIICIVGLLLTRKISPSLFKPFLPKYLEKCNIFDDR